MAVEEDENIVWGRRKATTKWAAKGKEKNEKDVESERKDDGKREKDFSPFKEFFEYLRIYFWTISHEREGDEGVVETFEKSFCVEIHGGWKIRKGWKGMKDFFIFRHYHRRRHIVNFNW